MPQSRLFTSESVSEGHPDKVCDQISDAILDAFLAEDPAAHVAVETLVTTNRIVLAGETRSTAPLDASRLEAIARAVVREIGYAQENFHWEKAAVECYVHAQSPDIAQGVDHAEADQEGAGDQGMMFGYACDETEVLMPAALHYAHRLLQEVRARRRAGTLPGLLPDAKSQVTLRYEDDRPVAVPAVVLSSQHEAHLDQAAVRALVLPVVDAVLPAAWRDDGMKVLVNPTGRFVVGGPDGDCGVTGRKIVVDTYGGAAPHGGGAFSGKDPTKVDRSAAYMARYLAKNVVAAGLARRCTVQLAYAIGVAEPLSVAVDCHGTHTTDPERLPALLRELVDLRPHGIRRHLDLHRPFYRATAAYGHFGRPPQADGAFSWERTDLTDALRQAVGAA